MLTPVDKKRCQAEKLEGSFMTLGPRQMRRCKNVPTVVATENVAGKDGEFGSMSLCDSCKSMFRLQFGIDYANFTRIQ